MLIGLVNDIHPDTTHTLRIDKPFSALVEHARSLDLDNMDSTEHSHVPWAILLVKTALEWKATVSLDSQWAVPQLMVVAPGSRASRSRWPRWGQRAVRFQAVVARSQAKGGRGKL